MNKYINDIIKIRAFESALLKLYNEGLLSGTVHTCIGQELNSIIISKYSHEKDYVLSNHRGHGHFLAFNNYNYEPLLKEILGRNDGCSLGIGGSQHISSKYFLSNGIQGGMTPIACGIAYGIKESRNVVFIFIGDGTLGQGVLYESLNMAGLKKLPVVFVCEDNEIAQSTPKSHTFSGDLKIRVEGFGVNYLHVNEIIEFENEIESSIENARNDKPQFIHINSSRLNSHSKGDDNRNIDFINSLNENDYLNKLSLDNKRIRESLNEKINFYLNHGKKLYEEKEFYQFNLESLKTKFNYDNSSINYSNKRYNERINAALENILKNNKKTYIIGEDIRDKTCFPCNEIEYGGAFKVTKGLSSKYPDNIINFPISEQLIAGFSNGLSLTNGWIICEIMFSDFMTLIFDQIYQHISKFDKMLGGLHKPRVIIRTPIGGYRGYGPTHSQSIESFFLGIDNFNVFAMNKYLDPSFYYESIFKNDTSTLLLENKLLYTEKSENLQYFQYNIINNNTDFPKVFLKNNIFDSNHLIITYGQLVTMSEEVSYEMMIENEIGIDILIYSDLNDFEISENLLNIISEYEHILILSESKTIVSWMSHLSHVIKNKIFKDIKILGNDYIIPASNKFEKLVLPNKQKLKKWILQTT